MENQRMNSDEQLTILDLPLELLEEILSYLSFERIAEIRLVSRKFNMACQGLLNKGFSAVDKYHVQCLKNIKSKLPRRESERKAHPLSRHCDILNTIETRISLLGMTFIKYIDLKMCCFIPGKVIDEIYRVLKLVETSTMLPRAHELLQELRDISSMAMEHFDEKIVPTLRKKILNRTNPLASGFHIHDFRPPKLTGVPKMEVLSVQQLHQQNSATFSSFRKGIARHKHQVIELKKKIQEQDKTIIELNHMVTDLSAKVSEQDGRLNELSRKLVDLPGTSNAVAEMIVPNVLERSHHELHLRRSPRVYTTKTTQNAAAVVTKPVSAKRKYTSSGKRENQVKSKIAKV